jgi:methylated-DNA-[protein]-cysteine S-methyltransferase
VSDNYTDSSLLTNLQKQVELYFQGKLPVFSIPYRLLTGTDFQRKVWRQLSSICYGETCSYKALAEKIGHPGAYSFHTQQNQ